MTDLYQQEAPIDIVTVSECLIRRKSLEAVGGRAYIALLSTEVPTTANAAQYARIVAEKAILRRLISAAGDMVEESYSEKLDPKTVLDHAEQNIFDIAKNSQRSEFSALQQVLAVNLERIREAERNGGQLPGVSSGFKSLDKITMGFQPSQMVIIAARPSMGKTAFALNIAQHAAVRQGKRVVIFSLEMAKEQLADRLLAMEARVDSKKLMTGQLSEEDWDDINRAVQTLSEADIIIDDTSSISAMEMRNKCRRINQKKKIDMIVVDYIQMMASDTRIENRTQEVTQISRSLKQMAREMECPVLALSQLSRDSEKRTGSHKPMLSDLRESGAIEQDADIVMFLYREDYYKDADEEKSNTCDILVQKHRTGSTGVATLGWQPTYTKFVDIYRES
jgi:replicative DNA helicase